MIMSISEFWTIKTGVSGVGRSWVLSKTRQVFSKIGVLDNKKRASYGGAENR